jgi:hypothetical protein
MQTDEPGRDAGAVNPARCCPRCADTLWYLQRWPTWEWKRCDSPRHALRHPGTMTAPESQRLHEKAKP